MKLPSRGRWRALGILLLLLPVNLGAQSAVAAADSSSPAVGDWLGALDVGAIKLRLALHVEAGSDGTLTATLDSVDQGAKLPVGKVTFTAGTLSLDLANIGAAFTGTLNSEGSICVGQWSQGGRTLPLTLERVATAFELRRPQEPKAPFPYTRREVTFRNEAASIQLAGTLILPAGQGPFPAVLFVSGSGPQDRDEQLLGHKPFLVIADFLARRGIASLRYDDRGTARSQGDHFESTVADFAADAGAGITFLAGLPEVDRKAIGIVGHSEGGLSGPWVATLKPELDFLVLLAPPAVPLDQLLLRQSRDVLVQMGVESSLVERAMAALAADNALIKDETLGTSDLVAQLRVRAEERRKSISVAELAALKEDEASLQQGLQQASTPWFRSLLRIDPAVFLRQTRVPVLALFGEKDLQVAAEVNSQALKAALAAAKNADYEVETLPGLNHLFQHTATGSPNEYGTIEESFAPEALERIAAWIEKRFGRRP